MIRIRCGHLLPKPPAGHPSAFRLDNLREPSIAGGEGSLPKRAPHTPLDERKSLLDGWCSVRQRWYRHWLDHHVGEAVRMVAARRAVTPDAGYGGVGVNVDFWFRTIAALSVRPRWSRSETEGLHHECQPRFR